MKRSFQFAAGLALALAVCGFSIAGSRPVASRTEGDATPKRVVDGVLSGERDGAVTNRARRLRSAVKQSPNFAPAQWQSGRVNIDGEWVPVEKSIPRLAGDKTLNEYRTMRAKTPRTLAGQLELATWCRQHKLYDQQRAHLTAALEIDPNHAAARKALGFVRMGPFWISQRELEQRRKDAVQAAKDLKRWAPTVKSIRAALTGTSRLRYQQALKRLKAIHDPTAIPAIELGLAYENPRLAIETIDYLGQKTSKESTLALARQGMLSPWKSLRKRAAEKLKGRRYEDFVPPVLAMTSTPLQSKELIYVDRRGSLFYRHVFHREARDLRIRGEVRVDLRSVQRPEFNGEEWMRPLNVRGHFRSQKFQQLGEAVTQQEFREEDQQRVIGEWNSRSGSLLATATGKPFGDDAKVWWRWWDDYSDSSQYSKQELKPEIRYQTETVDYMPSPFYSHFSCLVAGTPVWTDRGPVAIDKVQVGDQVLSQNVETGELAYKPVLRTTVRSKRPLVALEIGPRTINMTGGHTFWVSGKGWVKARDFKNGMAMRDVTGTTPVRPAGTAKPEPTYNLIVADFHTYFVGETKVLSHDITPAESTDVLVPGLPRTAGEKPR
jgi:hypothetical protein